MILLFLTKKENIRKINNYLISKNANKEEISIIASKKIGLPESIITRIHHIFYLEDLPASLTNQEFSFISTKIISKIINNLKRNLISKKIINLEEINMISSKANDIYTYYYSNFLIILAKLDFFISRYQPKKVIIFDKPFPLLVEFPAKKIMYDDSFLFAYFFTKICKKREIEIEEISDSISISILKLKIRHLLFTISKLCTLLYRSIKNYRFLKIKKSNLFFYIRGISQYDALMPIINELRKRGEEPTVVIDDSLQRSNLNKIVTNKNNYLSIHAVFNFIQVLKLFFRGLYRRKLFVKIVSSADLTNQKFVDIFEECLNSEEMAKGIIEICSRIFPETFVFIERMNKLFSEISPKIIVDSCMIDLWGSLIYSLANEYNCSVVTVQNSLLLPYSLPNLINSDFFIVGSSRLKKNLVDIGAPQNKILPLGLPQYDLFFKSIEDRKKKRIKNKIFKKNKIILIATQAIESNEKILLRNKEMINGVISVLQKEKLNYRIIIKIHPRENPKIYENFLKSSNKVKIISSGNILDILKISDVLVVQTSTVIFSSLVADIPVISYIPDILSKDLCLMDHLNNRAVRRVKNYAELKLALLNLLYDKKSIRKFHLNRNLIVKEIFNNYGVASQKISDFLLGKLSDK